MVKKLLALAASVLMLVGTAPTVLAAGPTEAPQVVVKISSDKTTAYPGDEITFTVSVIESEVTMAGAQFTLDIPEGLKFVPKSSKTNDDTEEKLKYDTFDFEEKHSCSLDMLQNIDKSFTQMALNCSHSHVQQKRSAITQ